MSTRKIADIQPNKIWIKQTKKPCFDPEHNPPKHCVFEPGIYEHVCPGCGKKTVFTIYPTFFINSEL